MNETGEAVFLDYASAIQRYGKTEANIRGLRNPSEAEITKLGKEVVKAKYGNLFDMYKQIAADDPYETPMKIYPAVHYTMGGLWVDYNLMTRCPACMPQARLTSPITVPTVWAHRHSCRALRTVTSYCRTPSVTTSLATFAQGHFGRHPEFEAAENGVQDRIDHLINNNGSKPVDDFHRRLGRIVERMRDVAQRGWTEEGHCGHSRLAG